MCYWDWMVKQSELESGRMDSRIGGRNGSSLDSLSWPQTIKSIKSRPLVNFKQQLQQFPPFHHQFQRIRGRPLQMEIRTSPNPALPHHLDLAQLRLDSPQAPSSDPPTIVYKRYTGESEIPTIMDLVDSELSEPYNFYTYRYFLADWCVFFWRGDRHGVFWRRSLS